MRYGSQTHESLEHIFDVATYCVGLQRVSDGLRTQMHMAQGMNERVISEQGLYADENVLSDVVERTLHTFEMDTEKSCLDSQIAAYEQATDKLLEGVCLTAKVLRGAGKAPIIHTYRSVGPKGTGQQEIMKFSKRASGVCRAAILGQNALVLCPVVESGRQHSFGRLIVPLVRNDGAPNVSLSITQHSRHEGVVHLANIQHDAYEEADLVRLRNISRTHSRPR